MAYYDNCKTISAVAGEDLSSTGLYRFGVFNSSGRIIVNTTAQAVVDGIIGEAVDAAGKVTQLVCPDGGLAKVMAGAAITAGARVGSDTTGRAITWVDAAGNVAMGRAITAAAAAGDIITIQFTLKAVGAGT